MNHFGAEDKAELEAKLAKMRYWKEEGAKRTSKPRTLQSIRSARPQLQRGFATGTEAKNWPEYCKKRIVELAKPLPPAPKAPMYQRFFATGLGASMWFFVSFNYTLYDVPSLINCTVDVPS